MLQKLGLTTDAMCIVADNDLIAILIFLIPGPTHLLRALALRTFLIAGHGMGVQLLVLCAGQYLPLAVTGCTMPVGFAFCKAAGQFSVNMVTGSVMGVFFHAAGQLTLSLLDRLIAGIIMMMNDCILNDLGITNKLCFL